MTTVGDETAGADLLAAVGASRGHFRYESGHHGVPLFALASLERGMWTADACPLCASGVPLAGPYAGRCFLPPERIRR